MEILKRRREMNNYTIQVRYSEKIGDLIFSLSPVDGLEYYRYIRRDELNKYYSIDSGLNLGEDFWGYIML